MMPEERTRVGVLDGLTVVTPPAEIDIAHAASFRAALADAAGGPATIVVDMSRTVFCDSTGLRLLLQACDRAREDGGELRLVLAGSQLLRIFSVTGFDQLFPVFGTLPEALAGRDRGATGARPGRWTIDAGGAKINSVVARPAASRERLSDE
jgi:anti-sigma B factor antagonist